MRSVTNPSVSLSLLWATGTPPPPPSSSSSSSVSVVAETWPNVVGWGGRGSVTRRSVRSKTAPLKGRNRLDGISLSLPFQEVDVGAPFSLHCRINSRGRFSFKGGREGKKREGGNRIQVSPHPPPPPSSFDFHFSLPAPGYSIYIFLLSQGHKKTPSLLTLY